MLESELFLQLLFFKKRIKKNRINKRCTVIKDVEVPPNDAVIIVDGRLVLEKTPTTLDRIYV